MPTFLRYEDAVKMSTQQLRKYILDQGIGKGTAVAFAAKAQCMAWATGSKPFDPNAVPKPKPEEPTPEPNPEAVPLIGAAVGDRVVCNSYGMGEIIEVHDTHVKVKFDSSHRAWNYYMNGEFIGNPSKFITSHTSSSSKPAEEVKPVPAEAVPTTPPEPAASSPPDLGAILAALVQSHIKVQDLDMKQVEALVKKEVEKAILPKTIKVEFAAETHEVKGLFHKDFKDLLKLAAMNLDPNLVRKKNIWMVGPAGGGKTTASKQVAEALGLRFGAKSMGLHTTKAEIFGQCYADGEYKATEFREIFENGGLFIFDECDRANPNLMTQLNAALENRFCSFPDKTIPQHEKCICIAGNNSYGRGSDGNYVGCQQQDASALDRWIFFEWNYDDKLERKLADNDQWVDRVQAIRKVVFDKREKVIVSPRASYHGADLLKAGFLQSKVEDMVIWKGINKEVKQRILAEM